jgi:hypothetical protein
MKYYRTGFNISSQLAVMFWGHGWSDNTVTITLDLYYAFYPPVILVNRLILLVALM